MLVTLQDILPKARTHGYAVGAFNINNLETCQAIVEAAAELNAPVILQTSEGAIAYAGMYYLAAIAQVAAISESIPIVFHLDHGKNKKLVEHAIASGWYSSVMYDGSSLPFKENIRTTKEIVRKAHAKKISVEAELGPIAGVEDQVSIQEKEAFLTDPDQVQEFVEKTHCDALAISIGTRHGAYKNFGGTIKLDLPRLKKIAAQTNIPLVLHGASSVSQKWLQRLHADCTTLGDCERLAEAHGIPEIQEKKAIALGVAKINVDTDLRIAFTAGIREILLQDTNVIDPRKIVGNAKTLMKAVVKEKIRLFKSTHTA